jgi:thioredoxin
MTVQTMTLENYEATIAENPMLIIDFWAEWCGPCKAFAPVFDSLAKQHPDVAFAKVNIEEQEELANLFGVRSIPTLAFFREEVLLHQQAGALQASQMQEAIKEIKSLNMDEIHAQIAQQKNEG